MYRNKYKRNYINYSDAEIILPQRYYSFSCIKYLKNKFSTWWNEMVQNIEQLGGKKNSEVPGW